MKQSKKILIILLCLFSFGIANSQERVVKFSSLTASEFSKLIKDSKVVIIDLRTANEFKSGHISKAKNIDIKASDFKAKFAKLDKKATIAIYCRNGAKSKVAAQRLSAKGYKVVELKIGLSEWKERLVK